MKYSHILIGLVFTLSSALTLPTPSLNYQFGTLVRAPQHDSAIVQSDQIGGNFAYSISENKAYQSIQPVLAQQIYPLGLSYDWNGLPILPQYHHPILVHYPWVNDGLIPSELIPTVESPSSDDSPAEQPEGSDDATVPAKDPEISDDAEVIETNEKQPNAEKEQNDRNSGEASNNESDDDSVAIESA